MVPANEGLTKADLVEEVAKAAQLTKKQAEAIVNLGLRTIVDSLRRRVEDRAARLRQLPHPESRRAAGSAIRRRGRESKFRPKRIPYFKPGKELKEQLNQTAS